jgi:hypothetical protein
MRVVYSNGFRKTHRNQEGIERKKDGQRIKTLRSDWTDVQRKDGGIGSFGKTDSGCEQRSLDSGVGTDGNCVESDRDRE